MQFQKGAYVFGVDDRPIGRITHVVLDPHAKIVTHIVVRRGIIFKESRVIPLVLLHSPCLGRIVLNDTTGNFHNLPRFEEPYYVSVEMMEEAQDELMMVVGMYPSPPAHIFPEHPGEVRRPVAAKHRFVTSKRRNIPEGAIALVEGADVISDDDVRVGHVESVLVDGETAHITHVLITRQRWLMSRNLIPLAWIDLICDDTVYLSVNAAALQCM